MVSIAILITALYIMGIIFLKPAFAGKTSVTFTASCYMPEYITTLDGERVLADSEKAKQKESAVEKEENNEENSLAENKTNIIRQQEEIVSDNNSETQLITTVCAR